MTLARTPVLAALAACLLAVSTGCRTTAAAPSPQAPPEAAAPPPSDPAALLPGVDLDDLSPEQRQLLVDFAQREFCYCGCPHTISSCLRTHQGCKHAPRVARLAARLVHAGAGPAELRRYVDDYYASFDRRARLDVTAYGPALGDEGAPVTLVEFSDFTCPFCQALRPALEAFVREHAARVKLYYKPFPIESHPGADAAAEAGEWARDQGFFWPMHDALFGARSHAVDDLAAVARALGGDPGDLRDAISSRRHAEQIRASQAEGRAAGMRGTPTLFMNGRLLTLPDYSAETLLMALEDEEEWQAHHGWERD